MARGLQDYPNVLYGDGSNSDFPQGRSKDNDGSGNGTPVNEFTLGDYQQFFAKLLREAGINANGLPESEYNGLQYFEALLAVTRPYYTYSIEIAQTGTNNPTVIVIYKDVPGTLTWARTGAGVYTLTYSGSISNIFSAGVSPQITPREGFATVEFTSSTVLTIRTFDATGTPDDGLLGTSGFRLDFLK